MAQLIKAQAELDLKEGVKVYYLNPKLKSWTTGTICEMTTAIKIKVQDDVTGEKCLVDKASEVHKCMANPYDMNQDDLFSMNDLHPSTLLCCVKDRFEKLGRQYTRMGEIVLSMNPFEPMEYNRSDRCAGYLDETEDAPHCWQIAHKAFRNIVIRDCGNQSVLISGESGAGKTETTKMLMDYLGQMSTKNSTHALQKEVCGRVREKLRDSNPILESFGNAKTVRNDNSSRFGKYIKLQLQEKSGVIVGAQMVTYLLEKSRITSQGQGERGYHVFYEFLAGLSPEEKAKYGGLKDAAAYKCLNQGGCYTRKSTDGKHTLDDAASFRDLVGAMDRLGIDSAVREQIWLVLASILHLQNIEFGTDSSTGKSKINTPEGLATASKLLGVDAEKLGKTFTIKSVSNIMTTLSTKNEAEDMRDAVSKALYQAVFDWLVTKLNTVIKADAAFGNEQDLRYIGLLDIFGFENFTVNSFEQLCINYTNEALQNHYNKYTFVEDSQECEREGIPCPIVDYPDNAPCVSLIEQQGGIFTILDEESSFKLGTDEGFCKKTWDAWNGKNPFFIQPKSTNHTSFGVHHYAGDVMYSTTKFCEKNADTLKDEVRELIGTSSAGDFMRALLVFDEVAAPGKKKSTVGSKFKKQLTALRAELDSTQSHFIRCIKPNPECKPKFADPSYVLSQLNSAGVVQTIQIKREGYPIRITHKDFWFRFRVIAPKADKKSKGGPEECRRILALWSLVYKYEMKDFAIGKTKCFMRPYVSDVLENRRQRKVQRFYVTLRPVFSRYVAKRRAEKERLKAMQAEQERVKFANNSAESIAAAARQQTGLDGSKVSLFEELAALFPHFDLAVVLGVVENTETRDQAVNIFMDMQRQRVDQHLPRSMKLILDLAGIRIEMQEKMAAKDFSTKEEVFRMTDADMDALEFTESEKAGLRGIILSQQSNWVAAERVNMLYPLRPLGRVPNVPPPDQATYSRTASARSRRPDSVVSRGGGRPAIAGTVLASSPAPAPVQGRPSPQQAPPPVAGRMSDEEFARQLYEEDQRAHAASQAQARPPQPPADAGPLAAEIQQLASMGFTDVPKVTAALQRTNGDVTAALDLLMS
eukprot:NODE_66_length_3581_cov_45.558704_g62_i0.p1 GENE.NODE_66_length_3581_cov_45.558704_g62_i0~~NODE_66_length_3581_cov_45.558704_g62_i0.p1  ORF type:complete len:1108 (+),score=302.19 NODE_66_length_3581_cov_45.558704_g62_i0:41-3325(+)